MRTNIDIDDTLMDAAMRAGPYSTKREAVEAGLQMLARKTAYRDILALRGQLQWDDGATPVGASVATVLAVHSPAPPPYLATAKKARRK
jgi:Arc/MetJ family transcription regulator